LRSLVHAVRRCAGASAAAASVNRPGYPHAVDLGPLISYRVLETGTPVFTSDGEKLGKVTHVIADVQEGVFDGVVIEEHLGHSGHRFVDADDIADIRGGGVILKLDREQAADLPEPSPNPPVIHYDPTHPGGHTLAGKLKRAWDAISGKS
jgi:sporulation protein YlmC with PRC-barrel domain